MAGPLHASNQGVFALRQTNVSSPSVIHSRPSLNSVAASEDYYSLSNSGSSGRSIESAAQAQASQQTITRFGTPPSRYRTPAQSQTQLRLITQPPPPPPSSSQPHPHHATVEDDPDEPSRKTPLRGEGQRRLSAELASAAAAPTTTTITPIPAGTCGVHAGSTTVPTPSQGQLRNGGIRRKPVPSVVMEDPDQAKRLTSRISPTMAQSSVAKDISRERDAPTPGVDDTPYIHFALDQLTRDEEVRGSRRYPGDGGRYSYDALNTGDVAAAEGRSGNWPIPAHIQQRHRYEEVLQEEQHEPERDIAVVPPARTSDRFSSQAQPLISQPQEQIKYATQAGPHQAAHPYGRVDQPQEPNVFIPVTQAESRQPPLNFVPGILRTPLLGLFILALLAYIVALIIAAAWSRSNRGLGLTRYDGFADGKYFVFRYLPTLLGMVILAWLFQIVAAVYRIAPFIAMTSAASPPSRLAGAKLPLQPRSWLRPYFGHFGARMPVVGTFLLLAWLQIFTIPLLASSFNVHQDSTGTWHWIAVQGAIWVVVGLYTLLLIASIVLLFAIGRTITGLKWDPRSLADVIVLLERSNALDGDSETVPQLGYFRTANRPTDVFHAYGIADKPARSYEVHEGRIQEKRYSDPDMDVEAGQRYSKESMIHLRHNGQDRQSASSPLPWFLKPFFALLWPIVAIVLVLAFLIVSYLPSTRVSDGFDPMVEAAVDTFGFSGTNFLYSFLPALLATIALLGWYDIDLAYRRLTPFESLTSINHSESAKSNWTDDLTGDIAERTLLPSYTADFPILISLSAAVTGHYRMAFISTITLLSTAIPILAGGVFWAQFYIVPQRVLISADMPAYITLSVFVTIYALAYLAIWPSSALRGSGLPENIDTFAGIRDCLSQSRLLDDFTFRNPSSRTDLVTRLLSYSTPERSNKLEQQQQTMYSSRAGAEASKVSLADSIRGFGRARAQAAALPVPDRADDAMGPARYAFSRILGRDGREYMGIDRIRRR